MKWLWKLTGGRPMRLIGVMFTDAVSGDLVFEFEDKLGRRWMAHSAWALFRVQLTLPGR